MSAFSDLVALAGELPSGELVDRQRVVDALLDLRNEAPSAAMVDLIDSALINLPGRTTVRSSWWQSTLDEIALAAELEASAAQPAV